MPILAVSMRNALVRSNATFQNVPLVMAKHILSVGMIVTVRIRATYAGTSNASLVITECATQMCPLEDKSIINASTQISNPNS